MIILGALFVALPYLSRVIPDLERIPWFILYVYKRDGFYFATQSNPDLTEPTITVQKSLTPSF